MNIVKVGMSPLTGKIYAGYVSSKGVWGTNKTDVTDDVMFCAVDRIQKVGEFTFTSTETGKKYAMKVMETI